MVALTLDNFRALDMPKGKLELPDGNSMDGAIFLNQSGNALLAGTGGNSSNPS
jgi:hypothetical protein